MMKSALSLSCALTLMAGAATAQTPPEVEWSLAIHGGAGVIERASLTPERDVLYRQGLAEALAAGSKVLEEGGSALDATEVAVRVLENNPLFNAGRGAVFTSAGTNELDAAVMDGVSRQAGAVAGLTRTKNPITVARAIMEKSPHVFMIGAGAESFARSVEAEEVEPSYFFTESRWQALLTVLRKRGEVLPARPQGAPPEPDTHAPAAPLASLFEAPLNEKKFGTVGAVARDRQGRLAAATSTGGMTAKRWGRVGDVPVIGAGTYASNAEGCAVSATGDGEYFIRATVARDICHHTAQGQSVQAAAEAEIADVGSLGGEGGAIVVGTDGSIAFAMNTAGMYRASQRQGQAPHVAIYADEKSDK